LQSVSKILFLDDHEGLREGMGQLLSQKNPSLSFVYAASLEEAQAVIAKNPDISLAILDMNLDGENGLDCIPLLRAINPDIPVIAYTMFADPLHIEEALKAGVQGFVAKSAPASELENAIRMVSGGASYYNEVVLKVMQTLLTGKTPKKTEKEQADILYYSRYKMLTKAEQQVFALLAQQKEPADIANILDKKEKTVINQRTVIYQKLNLHDRHDIIEYAKAIGVLV